MSTGRILTGISGGILKRNPQGMPEKVLGVFRKNNFGKVSYPEGTFEAIIGRILAITLCWTRGGKEVIFWQYIFTKIILSNFQLFL